MSLTAVAVQDSQVTALKSCCYFCKEQIQDPISVDIFLMRGDTDIHIEGDFCSHSCIEREIGRILGMNFPMSYDSDLDELGEVETELKRARKRVKELDERRDILRSLCISENKIENDRFQLYKKVSKVTILNIKKIADEFRDKFLEKATISHDSVKAIVGENNFEKYVSYSSQEKWTLKVKSHV